MKKDSMKTYEVRNRALVTLTIMVLYAIGRSLILYGVDLESIYAESAGAQDLLLSIVSGDRYLYSVMALGIMPYITVSMLVTLATMLRSSEAKVRTSLRRVQIVTYILTMLLSLALAVSRVSSMPYLETRLSLTWLRVVSVLELVAGSAVILVMATVNKKYGFAGQMPIIMINVIDNLIMTVQKHPLRDLRMIGLICLAVAFLTVLMESILVRIPVQRVSIHNDYADKSYIAFKLNPIGTMPVMFSTLVFMLPQLILRLISQLNPQYLFWQHLSEEMVMTSAVGIRTYLGIILLLTVAGSFLMLSPGDVSENLQKGGDSIVGIYAGRSTTRYLCAVLLLLSLLSGVFMSACMGISLFLSLGGEIPTDLAMMPSMTMMLASTGTMLVLEISAYLKFDSYKVINWE